MSQKTKEKVYFNKKQCLWQIIGAKDEYIVASRGFGKSEGVDAPRLLRNTQAMPRSTGALLSPTYAKLLQNTLPAIFSALERLGYYRNVHYYVGKRPPKNSNFKQPLKAPFSYDRVISWYNGAIQHMVSFDRPMSVNSMSLDYIAGYESKYLNYNKIKEEVTPAIRGNEQFFGDCPWHHGSLFTTDRPNLKSGMWIEDKEKDMDPELIKLIIMTYEEYYKLKNIQHPSSHMLRKLNKIYKELQLYRSKATFYGEANAIDNIEILGEEFLARTKRDLPDLIFQISILNKKIRKVPNSFYSAIDENIHCYHDYNNAYLEGLDYDISKTSKPDCRHDNDLISKKPLCIAMDYGAAINCLAVGQRVDESQKLRTLKAMWVKTPKKLGDLVGDFSDYYKYHDTRDVVFYYDSTAIAEDAVDAESYADIVINTLERKGWNVQTIYIGNPVNHSDKHLWIDNALKGDPQYLFPEFNIYNCEDLIIAMQQAGIKIGRDGFKKDKDPEKKPDTDETPDQFKTHITDAWDTLFVGCNYYPYTDTGVVLPTNWG